MDDRFMRPVLAAIASKSKVLLLEKLLERPAAFSVTDLSRLAGIPKATVSNIVSEWQQAGLVLVEYHGKNKLTKLNQAFYLLPELRKIFEKSKDFNRPLVDRLKSLPVLKGPKIRAVVVFGSRARKDFSHLSDLDVMIAIDSRNDPVTEQIAEEFVGATNKAGVRFSHIMLEKREILERLKEKDQFILNILNGGKIIKGGKWLEHIQAAP